MYLKYKKYKKKYLDLKKQHAGLFNKNNKAEKTKEEARKVEEERLIQAAAAKKAEAEIKAKKEAERLAEGGAEQKAKEVTTTNKGKDKTLKELQEELKKNKSEKIQAESLLENLREEDEKNITVMIGYIKEYEKNIKELEISIRRKYVIKKWDLSKPTEVDAWNRIIEHYLDNKDILFGPSDGRKQSISWSGLYYAHVNSNENHLNNFRENPVVFVAINEEYENSRTVSDFISKFENNLEMLIEHLYGFLPMSVIKDDNDNDILLAPMGLQKTPAGYGFNPKNKNFWDSQSYKENEDEDDYSPPKIIPSKYSIKGFFGKLMEKVKENYPNCCIITRFATDSKFGKKNIWGSKMLTLWAKTFPSQLKIGFKDSKKDPTGINDEKKPETYNPGKGGLIYKNDTLTIYNNNEIEKLKINNASTHKPIYRLLQKNSNEEDICDLLGCFLTVWPKIE